jgi:diphthamide synthase (EF-2-diphthine--ammonia ligase)
MERPALPLHRWKQDTSKLARTFIDLEFKAIVTCIDTEALNKSFAKREFDFDFLSALPSSVDPCGENREFHTFVYDGPVFQRGIDFDVGKIVLRENRFCFCDLIPREAA